MAKQRRARKQASQIEGFAEDLGTLLGSAMAQAERWIGQRHQIVKHLSEVRDTASKLLSDLGHQTQSVIDAGEHAYKGKRRGRPVGSTNKKAGIIIGGRTGKTISTAAATVVNKIRGAATEAEALIRPVRKMSAKARKAIGDAQRKRWARQKAAAHK